VKNAKEMNCPRDESLRRRSEAAARYKPAKIDLLLVAEAPPNSLDRYFYFTDVRAHDILFRYVCRVLLGREPKRERKGVTHGRLAAGNLCAGAR
jgi:hypothetical protein